MVQTSLEGTQADFEFAMAMIFGMLNGPLPEHERERIEALRGTPNRDVVLATWDAVLHSTPEELDATVAALAGAITVPYLSLHGIDPGPDYAAWLTGLVPTATVELWDELGHYPHLVEPDRFLARLAEFEAQVRG
jgi:pimeloyl-ACP methyl ester carboxylesterase